MADFIVIADMGEQFDIKKKFLKMQLMKKLII